MFTLNQKYLNVGNEYIKSINQREINEELLIKVVAEEMENTFILYHPEYKESMTPIIQAKNEVLINISTGINIAKNIEDKKELITKLKELRVLSFVMFALKINITDSEEIFKSLNINPRIRAIEDFMKNK